ncbi:hypothetical protein [Bacillus solitudinis]|uniref:hypothetical protein n=1 Tax=Bacillus solitudinis TaxID=2014074 RepID=UPI000C24A545|nr:hypothetical protein [Bacillus solitudinis]
MKLEYRLDSKEEDYPALWLYDNLSVSELVSRMTCEYFVIEGNTYHVIMTAKEPENLTVIYVKREEFKNNSGDFKYDLIGFEYKEVIEKDNYQLIQTKELESHDEALLTLHCDAVYLEKDGSLKEFKVDSREIDEDRKCYVYYGTFSNMVLAYE